LLVGEDSGDVVTAKLEDSCPRLQPQSSIPNTFLLASPSDFDSSGSAVYEISGLSTDSIIIQADPRVEEVKY